MSGWFGFLGSGKSPQEERGKRDINNLIQTLKQLTYVDKYSSIRTFQEERELQNLTSQNIIGIQSILEEFRENFRSLQKNAPKESFSNEIFENEEDSKDLIRICVWICKCFPQNIAMIRPSLDCICSSLRPQKSSKAGGRPHYLHLVLTEVLFEGFPQLIDENNNSRHSVGNNYSNAISFLIEFLSLTDFHVQIYTIQLMIFIIENNKLFQLQVLFISFLLFINFNKIEIIIMN